MSLLRDYVAGLSTEGANGLSRAMARHNTWLGHLLSLGGSV